MPSLSDLRGPLLELHKTLVDAERESYERSRGRMQDGEFLKALIDDPAFAWLGALTALKHRPEALVAHGAVMRALQAA